jgi:hypothetical protein
MTSPTRTERATKLRHTPKTIQWRRSANDPGIIGYAAKFASEINLESLVGANSRGPASSFIENSFVALAVLVGPDGDQE